MDKNLTTRAFEQAIEIAIDNHKIETNGAPTFFLNDCMIDYWGFVGRKAYKDILQYLNDTDIIQDNDHELLIDKLDLLTARALGWTIHLEDYYDRTNHAEQVCKGAITIIRDVLDFKI